MNTAEQSAISDFFKHKTVFITGGNGFLGGLFIEKILRIQPEIHKIYMLIRGKRGKSVNERMKYFFNQPIFDELKKRNYDFESKIAAIEGDLTLPKLGLAQSDQDQLIAQVQIVVHCAATVNFFEPIRRAAYVNLRATQDMISLAEQMPNLQSFLHVSTAFANSPEKNAIKEEIYTPPMTAAQLYNILDQFNDDQLAEMTPTLLKGYINTYIFTKCIAESIVNASSLPLAILRPAIVINTYHEPTPGWIDNFYGPTAIAIGQGLGILRTCSAKIFVNTAELVPADYVINCGLAALWKTTTMPNSDTKKIYNFVSSAQNPLTWGGMHDKTKKWYRSMPSMKQLRKMHVIATDSWLFCLVYHFFTHTLFALCMDFAMICQGNKPFLRDVYKKVDKLSNVLSFFSTTQLTFKNDNVVQLWQNGLSQVDRKLFPFSMDKKDFDWNEYFRPFTLGVRIYLLKDPIDTVSQAKRRVFIMEIVDVILNLITLVIVYFIMKFLFNCLF